MIVVEVTVTKIKIKKKQNKTKEISGTHNKVCIKIV